jgi:hypothetical protein
MNRFPPGPVTVLRLTRIRHPDQFRSIEQRVFVQDCWHAQPRGGQCSRCGERFIDDQFRRPMSRGGHDAIDHLLVHRSE